MKIYRRKMREECYQLPDPGDQSKNKMLNRGECYPYVKYLFITKVFESQHYYKVWGRPRKLKYYGIGILTDKNDYYYSEVRLRTEELTNRVIDKLKLIMLTRYNYTSKTRITLSSNIGKHAKDPMRMFVQVFASCLRINIHSISSEQMYRSVNRDFGYVKVKCVEKFGLWHRKKLQRKLFKNKRFDFIVDENWEQNLKLLDKLRQTSQMECAVGILYMNIKEINLMKIRKYNEKKIKNIIEEYNLNNKSEETENETE